MSHLFFLWSLLLVGIVGTLTGCGERIPSEAERQASASTSSEISSVSHSLGHSQPGDSSQKYSIEILPEKMTVAEKKERFAYLVAPVVESVHAELMADFLHAAEAVDTGQNEELESLRENYQVSSDQELLQLLKPHPQSIAMAQAALESAWGTSRFFRQANNIFGVWSFNKNEPRIAAGEMRGERTIWVKKYPSLDASIRDYFKLLAQQKAFRKFQKLKMETNDPFLLVRQLDHYSEKGPAYGKELSAMIRYNEFQKYD